MAAFAAAAETVLADSVTDLENEIATFGTSKTAVKTYLQEQYKSRLLLRNEVYNYTYSVGISAADEALRSSDESMSCSGWN
jgi:hypothetical protein